MLGVIIGLDGVGVIWIPNSITLLELELSFDGVLLPGAVGVVPLTEGVIGARTRNFIVSRSAWSIHTW